MLLLEVISLTPAIVASLLIRQPLVYMGGDSILRLTLFWSLFLPLRARFSLDARQGRVRAQDDRLLSNWPRLQQWLAEDAAFLLWRQQLREFRAGWERAGRPVASNLARAAYAVAMVQTLPSLHCVPSAATVVAIGSGTPRR